MGTQGGLRVQIPTLRKEIPAEVSRLTPEKKTTLPTAPGARVLSTANSHKESCRVEVAGNKVPPSVAVRTTSLISISKKI